MKILESNKVLQSVFSGMAINYLNTEYQNGYIRDIYNECKVVMNSSNSITVSTGMIVVEGIRLLFEEAETFNITSFPDSSLLHHLVLKVTATTEGENKAEIINRINEPLRQDEILKTGSGVYELELASYLLSPNGISNFAQTLLPIILTNEELQSFKEMIDELDKKVDALDQVIITANEDAERALTTVSNLTVGTVQKGTDPAASIDVDVIKKTAKLNLTLPKGDKGDNGTVITIDGEPQDYFNGNIINQITEESKNKFDINRLSLVKGTIDKSNSTITLNEYANDSVNKLKDFTDLEVGKTYILTFKKDNALSNNYIYLAGSSTQWANGTAHTITQAELDGVIIVYGRNEYTNVISEIMISETGGEYQPYNQKRNITNPQAEFLKDKSEDSSNMFNEFDAFSLVSYKLEKNDNNEFFGNSNVMCLGATSSSYGRYIVNVPKGTSRLYFKFKAKSEDTNVSITNAYLCTEDYIGTITKNYMYTFNKKLSSNYTEFSGYIDLTTNIHKLGYVIYFNNSNNSTFYLKDFMLSLYDVPFSAFNQKSKITNNQALVLKNVTDTFTELPNAYQRLKYLKSTGTQYIDTGFKPTNNTRVQIGLEIDSGDTTDGAVFGSRSGTNTTDTYILWANNKSGTTNVAFAYSTNTTHSLRVISDVSYDCDISYQGMYVNNIRAGTANLSEASFTGAYNAGLFGFHNGTSFETTRLFKGRVYYARIYDAEKLIRNFIPCYRKIDGVSGMYDLVEGKFYTNVGTGSFVRGPEFKEDISIISSEGSRFVSTLMNNSFNLFDTYAKEGELTVSGVKVNQLSDGSVLLDGTANAESWIEIGSVFNSTTNPGLANKRVSLDKTKQYYFEMIKISGSYTGRAVKALAQITSTLNSGSIEIGGGAIVRGADGIYRLWINFIVGNVFHKLRIGINFFEGNKSANKYYPHQLGRLAYRNEIKNFSFDESTGTLSITDN